MKYTELIPGEYYTAKGGNSYYWYIQFKKIEYHHVISSFAISNDRDFFTSGRENLNKNKYRFEKCTYREILWIQQCLKIGKWFPIEEMTELQYEIY